MDNSRRLYIEWQNQSYACTIKNYHKMQATISWQFLTISESQIGKSLLDFRTDGLRNFPPPFPFHPDSFWHFYKIYSS